MLVTHDAGTVLLEGREARAFWDEARAKQEAGGWDAVARWTSDYLEQRENNRAP